MIEDLPALFKELELPPNLKGINGYKFTINGCHLEIDHNMKRILDYSIKAVANKHDAMMIFTGYEGYGKTSNAAICAAYICHRLKKPFSVSNFKFLPEEVEKAVKNDPIGSVHIWDEAIFGLDSQDALTKVQRTMKKLFTVCRSRRQFLFLLIPNIWMLSKYFATSRTRFLIHNKSPDGIKRGYFDIYGRKNKRVLYVYGYKSYSYSGRKGKYATDCSGRFIDPFNTDIVKKPLIDQLKYEERKQKALETLETKENEKKVSVLVTKWKDKSMRLFDMLLDNFKQVEITERTGINKDQLTALNRDLKKSKEKKNKVDGVT